MMGLGCWRDSGFSGARLPAGYLCVVSFLLGATAAAGCGKDHSSNGAQDASVRSDSTAETLDAQPSADAGAADAGLGQDGSLTTHSCADPDPHWLLCEDFEKGNGDFDAFMAASDFIGGVGIDDRGRVRLDDQQVHTGSWSVVMPAEADSGYRGASLDWRDCDGPQAVNCDMVGHEQLYFRVWVRFAEDHKMVHHFLNIGGSRLDDYWYHGLAGCLPNGTIAMGTTVDLKHDSHESFFYTYFPEMNCDTRCDRYADVDAICQECESKGLPTCTEQPQCCWGNEFAPDPAVVLPKGRWFCLEMMMKQNQPNEHDGVMAYWVDGRLALRVENMMWRTVPELELNRVRLQHYITTDDANGFSNRVWFDDVVVSTERIGCH